MSSPTGRPVTDHEIRAAEQRLGVAEIGFPDDFVTWLKVTNGTAGWYGEVYLTLFALDEIVAVTEAAEPAGRLPGFVAIGGDGSRERFAFDFRTTPPPIVMVDVTAAGWDDGVLQALTFDQFMHDRHSGKPFTWQGSYR